MRVNRLAVWAAALVITGLGQSACSGDGSSGGPKGSGAAGSSDDGEGRSGSGGSGGSSGKSGSGGQGGSGGSSDEGGSGGSGGNGGSGGSGGSGGNGGSGGSSGQGGSGGSGGSGGTGGACTAAGTDDDCDGTDDDCDGRTDEGYEAQGTTCGVGACARTGTMSCADGHEVDSCTAETPAASDADCDGVDDDCNGETDEDYQPHGTTCGVGACASTGTTWCGGGHESDSCTAGTAAASDADCDGVDDDCSGQEDEDYQPHGTTCGVGACASTGVTSCSGGQESDSCTAGTAAASDADCDGADDDCSGQADEDYQPHGTTCGTGACASTGVTSCSGGQENDSCTAGTAAASDADCDDVDDDCSGQADEDYQPHGTTCGIGACASTGTTSCSGGQESDSCTAGTAGGSDADCDGVDDDCSGQPDEDYQPRGTTCGTGACASTGTTSCSGGQESDSCTAGTAAASDADCDGVDDDCSGQPDEDYVSLPTTCGVGACASTGATSCVLGHVVDSCTVGIPTVGDITCDGIDDDCDNTKDEDFIGCFDATSVGTCQNGIVVGIFSCSDGIGCTADSCLPETGSCDFVPSDSACTNDGFSCTHEVCVASVGCQTISISTGCTDGAFCNGAEVCDPQRTADLPNTGAAGCAPALPQNVPCNDADDIDNIACTDTVCVEDGGSLGHCESTPNDANCDNTQFCDGTETCNPGPAADAGGCVLGSNPCGPVPLCAVRTCDETNHCGTAINPSYTCADGNPCTTDTCNLAANPATNPTGCVSTPIPSCTGCQTAADCADAFACTVNSCVGNACATDSSACECFAAADCDDGVACTVDSCSAAGKCVHTRSDAICRGNDGSGLCDGADVCDPPNAPNAALGCRFDTTAPLACDDGLGCTLDSCDPATGCQRVVDDAGCAAADPLACDGIAFCNPLANPQQNPSGCTNPPNFVPCASDGIACTQEVCVEPTGQCVEVPNNDYCIAQPGGCGATCQIGLGCVHACNIATCQGKTYQCGDCLDNDGDCRIDSADDSCLGPCSNNETGYAGDIPGQNNAPCKMDCYFDQDTGAGNDDCYWSHSCDPLSVAPGYPPSGDSSCAFSPKSKIPGTQLSCAEAQQTQSLDCWDSMAGASPGTTGTDYCGELVPNGCDCFGCCEIPGIAYAVYLGSTDANGNGTCTPTTLTNPALCKPCTQVESCRNHCDTCEICVGRPLPDECQCQACSAGRQLCGSPCGAPCPSGQFCLTGCCVNNPQ